MGVLILDLGIFLNLVGTGFYFFYVLGLIYLAPKSHSPLCINILLKFYNLETSTFHSHPHRQHL